MFISNVIAANQSRINVVTKHFSLPSIFTYFVGGGGVDLFNYYGHTAPNFDLQAIRLYLRILCVLCNSTNIWVLRTQAPMKIYQKCHKMLEFS